MLFTVRVYFTGYIVYRFYSEKEICGALCTRNSKSIELCRLRDGWMKMISVLCKNKTRLFSCGSAWLKFSFCRDITTRTLPISLNYYNKSKFQRDRASQTIFKGRLFIGIFGVGLSTLFFQRTIKNEVYPTDISVKELDPAANSETYEIGLYYASQEEMQRQYNEMKIARINSKNRLIRLFYRIKFALETFIIEPLTTFARFLELSCIFAPVLLSYPMSFFGKRKRRLVDSARSGARLWYRYLRWSAEMAGPSFIKLGQWAASRTDIFSKGLCDELSNLHSSSKPHSLDQTKKIIGESFDNIPFEEIFDEFNEKPVGVGAIAQVYTAKLSQKALDLSEERIEQEKNRNDSFYKNLFVTQRTSNISSNTYVAIKVLHPNVEVKINRDLKVMNFFAHFINLLPTMEWLSLPDELEQFSILMRLQLDLRIEGLNLAKFSKNFRNRLDIHFPKAYLNFTTRYVLVEEYMYGIPLSDILSLNDNYGKNLSKEISNKGLDAFLQMLILDNFVHADLHPGNMMVRFYKNEVFKDTQEYKIVKSSNDAETDRITEELLNLKDDKKMWCQRLSELYQQGYHAEICFLDVGLVTELKHNDRVNFIELFRALSAFDGYNAGELMVERSRTPETAVNKEIFALKVERLVNKIKDRTFALGNISIGDLLDQVLGMVRQHHVRMEGDFVTVIVAILLLEGIGRQLDPNLDLFARFVYTLLFDFPTEGLLK